jgi:hypothetical protein
MWTDRWTDIAATLWLVSILELIDMLEPMLGDL